MRLLVTGGAGFIGSHFVRRLLSGSCPGYETARLTVLDKLTYAGNTGNLPLDDPRLRLVRGDVCDRQLLLDLLPGHDAVVHFAAESHVDRSIADASLFARTNVVGTQNLLDSCLHTGVPRVVHVSTDEVYGSITEGSWDEDCPLLPNSPYSASKAGSDLMARAYWHTHGLNVSVTRCANNYGPYQHPEKMIPRFVTRLLAGGSLPLYGDGHHRREWIHVDDHCRAVQLVLEKGEPGTVYNVGGTELSNRELTGRLLHLCGAGWDRVSPVVDRKGHDRRYSVDDTRIRDHLGFEPAIPLDAGLAEVVHWYRDHRSWWQPLTDPAEEGQ
ncbi:dTDP-glucose 4,6-dehydratase [Streptomyces minutiscleroticus]|uniref:dTDP-glucose 4,6-dehydratase n=2 Tax=Streptomyces TaxID=1883 RepID=M1QE53_9ACTN|nr:dTDP-glucose 4,6-dehydratase [Streptomyces minutiscleroticus]AGG12562.1 NDP-4-6-dehydratase [Streptomyces sp. 275]AXB74568.1 NDP-4,6-(glucose)-dehydratase [Streptomyces roseiscleroticus]